MCTAVADGHFFGRTLDLECSYGEQVVITPRAFPFHFRYEGASTAHLAMVGMAHVADHVPLYYDALNEAGLAAAALNFSHSTTYLTPRAGARNVASFEVIPWILGQCSTLPETVSLLEETVITADAFSPDLTPSPLHWLIADAHGALTLESTVDGLHIYENPVGVLANEPAFPYHMTHLSDFMSAGAKPPVNRLCPSVPLPHYSRGMGGMGLPGDFSSPSRFVRAVFAKHHTVHGETDAEEISRFFHVMDTVSQPRGCALTDEGKPISTVYTSCADMGTGTYYFTTYGCRRIRGVRMTDTGGQRLTTLSIEGAEDVLILNEKG